ncbi:uncharacterized protein AruCF_5402 [Achromobacter ruhlandii]|nr:uncharacterized protein AruCF_5402 [Achromobacter ruhlandii]
MSEEYGRGRAGSGAGPDCVAPGLRQPSTSGQAAATPPGTGQGRDV